MVSSGSKLRGSEMGDNRGLQDSEYSDAELEYFRECENTLLGDSIVADGLISQQEFASAFSSFCDKYAESNTGCPSGSFASLPDESQSIFFRAVCETMPDPAQCANNLKSLNSMPFGYIVSDETMPAVQMQVQGLCLVMLDKIFVAGTAPSPASSPSGTTQAPVVDTSSLGQPDNGDGGDPSDQGFIPNPDDEAEQEPLDLPVGDDSKPVGFPRAKNISGDRNSFAYGPIIGIVVLAAVCAFLLLFVAYRRRTKGVLDKQEVQSEDEGTCESDPESQTIYPKQLSVRKGASLAQFDAPKHAAAIALKMSSDASYVSQSSFGSDSIAKTIHVSVGQIEVAVDRGNWDEVYQLASQLAEQEDLSVMSSAGREKFSGRLGDERIARRSQLREEDHERTRTLDELIDNRDWTGVAVTAALYAGESGYRKQNHSVKKNPVRPPGRRRVINEEPHGVKAKESPAPAQPDQREKSEFGINSAVDETKVPTKELPLLHLKDSMDYAVDKGDWDQVVRISSEVENNGAFQTRLSNQANGVIVSVPSRFATMSEIPTTVRGKGAFKTLIEEMDHAMSRGDWALVAFYANKIREIKISGDDRNESVYSGALVPVTRPQSIESARTEDSSISILSKKSTLEKLIQAEKWKGVAIMAGLYEMEAKGSLSAEAGSS